MSSLLRKRRPTASGTGIGPSSSKKKQLIDATKMVLDVANESSDWFPPLQSCLGGINALIKHYDECEDVKDKLEELIPWLTKLLEGLAKVDGNEDQQEAERRTQLARSLEDIAQQSQTLLSKGKWTRVLDKAQDTQEVGKLVEQLRQAILIYQVSQQQSINNQVVQLASSLNVLLGLHGKLPGIKGKIGSALVRLDRLRASASATGNAKESKRRTILFDALEGINDELQSLSDRSGAPDYQENDTDVHAMCELAESIRDTILEYQFTQQKALYEQNCKLIDTAESLVLNHCRRAQGAGYQHGDRQGCLNGTREDVLNEIECWAEDFNKFPVFWLNGLAGTGKSTIAQTVSERMFANGRLGASFFCSRGFEDRSNLKLIFPTLAIQLAQKYPAFRSSLIPLLQSNPDVVHESLQEQMHKFLVEPLQSAGVSTVIVIDALDECTDNDPESAILLVLGQSVSRIPQVKFFITSRPETHIVSGFRGPLLTQSTNIFILHHVKRYNVDSDIHHFLKHKLSKLAHRPQNWPTNEQLDSLCQRAAGFFVYAVATFNFLNHHLQDPSDQLDVIMAVPESTAHEGKTELEVYISLDSLYMSIFQKSFCKNDTKDDAMVRSILSTVVLVTNPLSPSAIAMLTGFHCDQVQCLLGLIQSLLILPDDPNHTVQLFHKSFSDFITDPSCCSDPRFYISPYYQIELFLHCLKLMDRSLKKNMCSIPDYTLNSEMEDLPTRIEGSGIHGALEYACRSWHKHLIVTEYQITDVISALCSFLEQKFLFWLEILSVLGAVGGAVHALNATIKWINEIQIPIDTKTLLDTTTDCLHFVTEFFEVINQSTPHIYHSALQLTPKSSIVWKSYNQEICSPVVRVVTGIPASWDSCTASVGTTEEVHCAAWSPCSPFIATDSGGIIQVQNPSTLERESLLKPPGSSLDATPNSLTFSPDGHLLACSYQKHLTKTRGMLIIWDTQTGVVIKGFDTQDFGKVMFHGDQRTITLIPLKMSFYTYNALNGILLCQGDVLPSGSHQLGTHWTHGDTLWFVTSHKTNRENMVNIHKLQPTSTIPLHLLSSLPIPPQHGAFSFSQVSSHASFSSKSEVVILNVLDQELLLQAEVDQKDCLPGHFSPNGCFFASKTLEDKIYIWQNTATGYIPWCSFRPRLPFYDFSWSPTSTSILCWGERGIQLLHPKNSFSSPFHEVVNSYSHDQCHLVAYSADYTCTVTARKDTGIVTLLNHPLGTSQQFTIKIWIEDIKIVDNTIYAAGHKKLISWNLGADRTVYRNQTLDIPPHSSNLTLSHDCFHIAFSQYQGISLYNVKTQKTISKDVDYSINGIWFSLDNRQLWCVTQKDGPYFIGWEIVGGLNTVTATRGALEDGWSLFNLYPPYGYNVRMSSEWIVDSRGSKLFWLPPNWRASKQQKVRWDGSFLAFIGSHHPEPIIIEFQHNPSLLCL